MHRRTIAKMLLGAAVIAVAPACRADARVERRVPRDDLYPCEGCEAVRERDAAGLDWRATITGPDEPGERMVLSGVVYQTDGRTPAGDVVIYAHQTNVDGLYADGTSETEWSRRHGRLRGWVKTGADGRYAFDTIKPGIYPDGTEPAHIHLFVLEPERRPYFIDDVVFEGEPGVTPAYRARQRLRGGDGIIALDRRKDGTWLARRDIVLELHPN